MAERSCAGCGLMFSVSERERRMRKWCSEACRLASYRSRNPSYRERDTQNAKNLRLARQLDAGSPIAYATCVECRGLFVRRIPSRGRNICYRRICINRRNARQLDPASRQRSQQRYRNGAPAARTVYTEAKRSADQRRRAIKLGATVKNFKSVEVFERDGWICGLCGESVDSSLSWPHPQSASLDHVLPLSRGGPHSKANSQLAHLSCNVIKGARIDDTEEAA